MTERMDSYKLHSIPPKKEMKPDFNTFNKTKRRKNIHDMMKLILNERKGDILTLFTLINNV